MSDYVPGPEPEPPDEAEAGYGAAEPVDEAEAGYPAETAYPDTADPLAPPAASASPLVPEPPQAQPFTGGGTPAGASASRPIAPKEYYSISEVCELVGLKPHVLRYWESQFPVLNPSKNRSGNRVYQRKEIKLVLLVQHLLYKEKYTIEGARQRLDQLRRGGKGGELAPATAQAVDAEMRKLLRDELTQLLEVLSPPRAGGAGRPAE